MNQEPRVTIQPSPFVMLVTAGSAVMPPETLTQSMYGSPPEQPEDPVRTPD